MSKRSRTPRITDSALGDNDRSISSEIREDWESRFKMLEMLTRELFVFGNPHDPKWMAIWKQIFALCKETT